MFLQTQSTIHRREVGVLKSSPLQKCVDKINTKDIFPRRKQCCFLVRNDPLLCEIHPSFVLILTLDVGSHCLYWWGMFLFLSWIPCHSCRCSFGSSYSGEMAAVLTSRFQSIVCQASGAAEGIDHINYAARATHRASRIGITRVPSVTESILIGEFSSVVSGYVSQETRCACVQC